MKTKMKILVICGVVLFVGGAARSKDKTDERTVKQIIVRVHRSSYLEVYTVANLSVRAGGRPLHDMGVYLLKKSNANHWLAEIKCSDCQVIPIFDDDVQLGVITQISEMVTNAGFRNIRPFVYLEKDQADVGASVRSLDEVHTRGGRNRTKTRKGE